MQPSKKKKAKSKQTKEKAIKRKKQSEKVVSSPNKRKKTALKAIIFLIIVAILILLYQWLNKPSIGSVKTTIAPEIQMPIIGTKNYENEFFSFTYPDNYQIKTELRKNDEKNQPNSLSQLELISTDHPKKRILVTLSEETVPNLEQVPSVQMRVEHNNQYKRTNAMVDGREVAVFDKDQDGFERDFFNYKERRLTVISVFSNFRVPLTEAADLVSQSFKWK